MPTRVVFFGTSEFACPALRALAQDSRFAVKLVVTQPNSRAGRGQKMTQAPVCEIATEAQLPLVQPHNVDSEESMKVLRETEPDLFVTAAYGQKLSPELLKMPRLYALNLHGSLLPRHRGASPVQRAIVSGDQKSGVTLMGMTSRMDAGPIYAQKEIPILPNETAGSLEEKLAILAQEILVENADALIHGKLQGRPQEESQATKAPGLDKDDGRVNWDRTAAEIDRHVRGMSPWPGAFTFCPTDRSSTRLIVVTGEVLKEPSSGMPGTVVAFAGGGIEVATRNGIYRVTQVKRSGKRALPAAEFLRGFPLPVGTRLQ